MRAPRRHALVHLLLLLSLLVGGQISATMPLSLAQDGAQAATAQGPQMDCPACGGANFAAGACNDLCPVSPTVAAAAVDLAAAGSPARWSLPVESGMSRSVRPDASPPRA